MINDIEIGEMLSPEDFDFSALPATKEEENPDRLGLADYAPSPYPFPLNVTYGALTGGAGTGKTWAAREAMKAARTWEIKFAATTGIAAVNLGANVTTINALLGFFDEKSLEKAYKSGKLKAQISRLHYSGVRMIVVDEMSMMSKMTLEFIFRAIDEFNQTHAQEPMRLLMIGDFCQLAPIPGRGPGGNDLPVEYAFEADCWRPNFGAHMTKLTDIKRQSDPVFIAAMNAARRGLGGECVDLLKQAGVVFGDEDPEFTGTTVVGTNDEADAINQIKLAKLVGSPFYLPSYYWAEGREPSEWKHLPKPNLTLKTGARVMITTNIRNSMGQLLAANGDIGDVVGLQLGPETYGTETRMTTHPWVEHNFGPEGKMKGKSVVVKVKLARTGETVDVYPIIRGTHGNPESWIEAQGGKDKAKEAVYEWGKPSWNAEEKEFLVSEICYIPLRLAWALTCHKTQGLTLDKVQILPQHRMFTKPAMGYVALSRAKTPGGLFIAASAATMAKKIVLEPRVQEWL